MKKLENDKYNTLMISNYRVFLSPAKYDSRYINGFVCSPN
jgi:hypothetical protein